LYDLLIIISDPKDISESTPTIHIPVSRQSDSYTFSQTDCNTISDEDEEEYEEQDKEGGTYIHQIRNNSLV
jgi:hypothetical protein